MSIPFHSIPPLPPGPVARLASAALSDRHATLRHLADPSGPVSRILSDRGLSHLHDPSNYDLVPSRGMACIRGQSRLTAQDRPFDVHRPFARVVSGLAQPVQLAMTGRRMTPVQDGTVLSGVRLVLHERRHPDLAGAPEAMSRVSQSVGCSEVCSVCGHIRGNPSSHRADSS